MILIKNIWEWLNLLIIQEIVVMQQKEPAFHFFYLLTQKKGIGEFLILQTGTGNGWRGHPVFQV